MGIPDGRGKDLVREPIKTRLINFYVTANEWGSKTCFVGTYVSYIGFIGNIVALAR